MALTDNDMVMPVSPYGGGNGFGGGFGNDWGWIILLLLFAGGGWGNGFGGIAGGNELYPWINQSEVTTNGFQNLSTQNQITAVQSDLGDIQTQLCNGFAGVNATVSNGFAQAEIAENSRAMANMQQLFGLQSQFADCCCENRLATCQTQNIIQNEGNATRFADSNNTRDIMQTISLGNQAILDKLCQLELDGVKQNYENRIAGMQNVIDGLNAQVNASDRRVAMGEEVDALYNRLSNCPVPSTPVYGRTPIFTCNQNQGCGCGSF